MDSQNCHLWYWKYWKCSAANRNLKIWVFCIGYLGLYVGYQVFHIACMQYWRLKIVTFGYRDYPHSKCMALYWIWILSTYFVFNIWFCVLVFTFSMKTANCHSKCIALYWNWLLTDGIYALHPFDTNSLVIPIRYRGVFKIENVGQWCLNLAKILC